MILGKTVLESFSPFSAPIDLIDSIFFTITFLCQCDHSCLDQTFGCMCCCLQLISEDQVVVVFFYIQYVIKGSPLWKNIWVGVSEVYFGPVQMMFLADFSLSFICFFHQSCSHILYLILQSFQYMNYIYKRHARGQNHCYLFLLFVCFVIERAHHCFTLKFTAFNYS